MADFYNIEDNPYDANYDFGFLDRYLSSVNRGQASRVNQELTSDNDFYSMEDEEDEVELAEEPVETLEEESEEELSFMDNELFQDDVDSMARQFAMESGLMQSYAPGSASYKTGIDAGSIKPTTSALIDKISSAVGNVVVTSGKRSVSQNQAVGGKKNSFHLTGDAVDLRPSKELDSFLTSKLGRQVIAENGYEIIDERSKKGGAHWHLEPARKQTGGKYKVAGTQQEQQIGLNDSSVNRMILPLKGTNTIRGLDSGEPVEITDEIGNTYILHGPDDTIQAQGTVKEKRLKYKLNYGKA